MLLHCPRGCRTTFILRLVKLYNGEKTRGRPYINLNRPYDRVAHAMGMTVDAVKRMVYRAKDSSHSRLATPYTSPVFDNFTIGGIRRFIHKKFAEKHHVKLVELSTELKSEGLIPEHSSQTAIWRLMHTMGFRYKVSQRKMYVRKESPEVVSRRIRVLQSLKQYRKEGTLVVYVDETWFTTRMGHSREWVDTTQAVTASTYSRQVPPGDGERFVVIAGGTEEGFVEASYLCYPAKSTQGDYHGEMNGELFQLWLTTHLLPALPEPSVLVLDNAPYHTQLTEESRCPTTATKKADLIRWLEHRNISIPPGATRPQLLLLCQQNRPEPQYEVASIIREWGHEVVWLPPGHPELNAIEQVWGCMKRHVRSSLHRFTRTDLQARLKEAKQLANKEVWLAAVRHSQKFEQGYWKSDNIHEGVDPVVINLASDDESDDVFLDSDCE